MAEHTFVKARVRLKDRSRDVAAGDVSLFVPANRARQYLQARAECAAPWAVRSDQSGDNCVITFTNQHSSADIDVLGCSWQPTARRAGMLFLEPCAITDDGVAERVRRSRRPILSIQQGATRTVSLHGQSEAAVLPAVALKIKEGEPHERLEVTFYYRLRQGGDMMIGVSRMALPDKVSSYEYLRLESRADGIYYVAAQKGKAESAFKLTKAGKDRADEVFTFSVEGTGFPTSITYRRGSGGWLYVEVAGVAQGRDHKVTYPFRRVSCETGEFIRK